jgi:hypothetical protein
MSSKNIFSSYMNERKYTVRTVDCDGNVYFETRQDVAPIVEFVKRVRDKPKDLAWTHLGEIPLSDLGQMMRDGSLDDEKYIRKYLNDRPALKVYEGKL